MKRLTFEQLESRDLLTAVVSQSGDTLNITGSTPAEYVEIRQLDVDSYRVLGNVSNSAPQGRYHNIEELNINLAAGNDDLWIRGAFIDDSLLDGLTINLAGGNDFLQISNFGVFGPTTIIYAAGIDEQLIENSHFTTLDITSGTGNDILIIQDQSIIESLTINTNSGNDAVGLYDSLFDQDALIELATGDDLLDIAGCVFDGPTILDGGENTGDFDELYILDTFFRLFPTIQNFEN